MTWKTMALPLAALLASAPVSAAEAPSGARASVPLQCPAFSWVTLGTSGGPIPMPGRSEPANLLIAGQRHVLVDAGDGAAVRLADYGLALGELRDVFISHHHLDHTAGLSGIIGLRWMLQYTDPITIYGPAGTRELVDGLLASYGPQARIGFGTGTVPRNPKDQTSVVELAPGDTVDLGALRVVTAGNTHFGAADGKTDAQSLSFRFELGNRSIGYTGDTGPSDAVEALVKGSDILVSEVIEVESLLADLKATRPDMTPQVFANLRKHLETHHLPPASVGQLASAAGVKRIVLTHLTNDLAGEQARTMLSRKVAEHFGGPVETANDLQVFDVGCR